MEDWNRDSLEKIAADIFGAEDREGYERWLGYWKETVKRNRRLVDDFEQLVLIDFEQKRVLDVGCGNGGIGPLLEGKDSFYVGGDYHYHILRFSQPAEDRQYLQFSGTDLPFEDNSFDLIFAFDVIEHLVGGTAWQQSFLNELHRVLSPLGMIFLTTPNFWYPYDAHTGLYFPQYLPAFLRDRYIAWRNPSFLREYESFDEVKLVKPSFFRKAIRRSGLVPLHDLPCGLDRDEFVKLHPFYGWLSYLGLGWYFHAEYWTILVRQESKPQLRLKLRRNWHYETNQPGFKPPDRFRSEIDFGQLPANHQLGDGWHWLNASERGFRWMSRQASCYLEADRPVRFVTVEGSCPEENHLSVSVNGMLVGEHVIEERERFQLRYLLPFTDTDDQIHEISLQAKQQIRVRHEQDKRDLSLMIFSVRLES